MRVLGGGRIASAQNAAMRSAACLSAVLRSAACSSAVLRSAASGITASAFTVVALATITPPVAAQDPPKPSAPVPADPGQPEGKQSGYASTLKSAADALGSGDADTAQRLLDSTEMTQRGFEWEHLQLSVELAIAASAAPGVKASTRLSEARVKDETSAAKVVAVSTMRGQTSSARAIAISPAGDRIAAAGLDNDVRLWNALTGDTERLLVGHAGPVTALAFAAGGERLASASEDGTARVWKLIDGECVLVLAGCQGALSAIAWSADGAHFAAADAKFTVRVWDSFQSQARYALHPHTAAVLALAFSPDGKHLAAASKDGSVTITDVARGEVVRTLRGGSGGARTVAFEPGRARMSVGREDGTVRRFDLATGQLAATFEQKSSAIEALAFTPDGRRFVTGTEKGALQVWDPESGVIVHELEVSGAAIRGLAFDARASRLLVGAEDRTLRVYETEAARARGLQRPGVDELPTLERAAEMKPMEVEAVCRRVVHHAGLDPALYEQARVLSRAALKRLKESGQIATTVAGAVYRLGDHEDALELLTDAAELKRGWPPNLAFRAMALSRLGKIDEAKASLQRLGTVLEEERWRGDADMLALADEARAVLAAAIAARK